MGAAKDFVGWCQFCRQGMVIDISRFAAGYFYCPRCFHCYHVVKMAGQGEAKEESHAGQEARSSAAPT